MRAWPQRLRRMLTAAAALICVAATVPHATTPSTSDRSPTMAPAWSDAWLLEHSASYLDDPAARRAALERSLSNPGNLYSRMRLAAYGQSDRGWDALPTWNPSSRPLERTDVGVLREGTRLQMGPSRASLWDGRRPTTMADWVELGRMVFERYPLRSEPAAEFALARGDGEQRGLHRDADGGVPGVVVYADLDGTTQVGITCALCHSVPERGELVYGRARRTIDYGAMRLAYEQDLGEVDPDLAQRYASWGPGRADITEDDDQDPVAIPDLWRLRELRHLTQAATIVHDSPLALALRQETQMLHASGERVRPPRELAWALSMFLYTLAPPSTPSSLSEVEARGEALFSRHCRSCHRDDNGSGPAIAASRVGVDPALARGAARGTGRYRPAPLVAVTDAAPYLHTGQVATLEALLDPLRLSTVSGHAFGTELSFPDRAAIVAWLKTR